MPDGAHRPKPAFLPGQRHPGPCHRSQQQHAKDTCHGIGAGEATWAVTMFEENHFEHAKLPSIRAAGIAPQVVFIGVIHLNIPGVNTDVTDRAAKRGIDGSIQVPGADAFLGIIGPVVEILRLFLVRFPKSHILRLHAGQLGGRIIGTGVANHRAVHGTAGQLLLAFGEQWHVGPVHRAQIKTLIAQRIPEQTRVELEPGRPGGGAVQGVKPALARGRITLIPVRPGQHIGRIRCVNMGGNDDLLQIVDVRQ